MARLRRTLTVRLLLLTAAPAALVLAPLDAAARTGLPPWWLVGGCAAALLLAALAYEPDRLFPRLLATAAMSAWVGLALVENAEAPGRALFILLGLIVLLAAVWPSLAIDTFDAAHPQERLPELDFVGACVFALVVGFDVARGNTPPGEIPPIAASCLYMVLVLEAWRRYRGWRRWDRWVTAVAAVAAILPAAGTVLPRIGGPQLSAAVGSLAPAVLLLLAGQRLLVATARDVREPQDPTFLDLVLSQPARALVLSFLLLCAGGTLLLELPAATVANTALSWLDAAFTAVSATCVTGLIVLDTPVDFSFLGQAIILGLIQVGGLGIMVFSAAAFVLLGRRLSLTHERAVADVVGVEGRAGVRRAVREILVVTAVTEVTATLVLFGAFLAEGDSVAMAAWRGLFTAISAFCNAGFALQSDSLIPYQDNPLILLVVAITIVVGGLGPSVVAALVAIRSRWNLHVRLVLVSTVLLIVGPTLAIASFEWNESLGGLSFGDRIVNAFFQAVTLRTAGFNSVDFAALTPPTTTLMILMMFVGGSPASTAGGVKTTTIAIVVLAVLAVIQGRDEVDLFGRRLPRQAVMRAVAVTTLGVLGAALGLLALQITQTMPLETLLFEVVSALGTVGLSLGATSGLDEIGKVIVIACMFVGRVGPLSLFVFLSSPKPHAAALEHPTETVLVG